MREISATEASRNFARLLDEVEHGREAFTIVRHGRAIARLGPAPVTSARAVLDLLAATPVDDAWSDELRALRERARPQVRDWPE